MYVDSEKKYVEQLENYCIGALPDYEANNSKLFVITCNFESKALIELYGKGDVFFILKKLCVKFRISSSFRTSIFIESFLASFNFYNFFMEF